MIERVRSIYLPEHLPYLRKEDDKAVVAVLTAIAGNTVEDAEEILITVLDIVQRLATVRLPVEPESREEALTVLNNPDTRWPVVADNVNTDSSFALSGLHDKNGTPIPIDSIICGPDPEGRERHFFNFGYNSDGSELEMIACTYGYVHNVKQVDVDDFIYIGPLNLFTELLNCD